MINVTISGEKSKGRPRARLYLYPSINMDFYVTPFIIPFPQILKIFVLELPFTSL